MGKKLGVGGSFLFLFYLLFIFSLKMCLLTVTNTSLQHQAFSPSTQSLTKGVTIGLPLPMVKSLHGFSRRLIVYVLANKFVRKRKGEKEKKDID